MAFHTCLAFPRALQNPWNILPCVDVTAPHAHAASSLQPKTNKNTGLFAAWRSFNFEVSQGTMYVEAKFRPSLPDPSPSVSASGNAAPNTHQPCARALAPEKSETETSSGVVLQSKMAISKGNLMINRI